MEINKNKKSVGFGYQTSGIATSHSRPRQSCRLLRSYGVYEHHKIIQVECITNQTKSPSLHTDIYCSFARTLSQRWGIAIYSGRGILVLLLKNISSLITSKVRGLIGWIMICYSFLLYQH